MYSETSCKTCSKIFRFLTSSTGGRKFCSTDCYHRYTSLIAQVVCTCGKCGKEFKRKRNKVVGKEKVYCSRKCSAHLGSLGRVWSDEEKEKSSATAKKLGFGRWMKGRKLPENTIEKMRLRTGENHPQWKGGVTPKNQRIRRSREYKEWMRKVYERDDFRCQWCGVRGLKLNADHIKPFSIFPKDRLVLKNGRTLCEKCHRTRTAIQLTVSWSNQYMRKEVSKALHNMRA